MGKHGQPLLSIGVLVIFFSLCILPTMSFDAFAASPTISAYIANDPDDGDTTYGAGDTLTITTNIATNATVGSVTDAAFVTGNFTFAVNPLAGLTFGGGNDWTAEWTDASTLVITILNTGVNTPVVGVSTVNVSGGNTIGDQTADDAGMAVGAQTLSGDFGVASASSSSNSVGGDGCDGDCEEPTLGVDSTGRRLVSNGFTYNGKSVDVQRFFTPYPLITVDVGKQNKAEFKIYENEGPENIRHFSFAFGLKDGEIISESKAMIELDIDFDGTETVTVTDPENALENVRVETNNVSCDGDERVNCLGVVIYHTFRAPLDFNIVATDVWDTKRSAWQNYYNHGIEVVGESLNPPKEYDGINKGQIYHLTETSKTSAVDDFGNTWSLVYDQWIMDYVPNHKVVDEIAMNGYPREHAKFNVYKYGQYLIAENKLYEMCSACSDESYDKINDIFTYEYPQTNDRSSNPNLNYIMKIESEKAQEIVEHILDPLLYRK